MRAFYVINIGDEVIRACINAIRIICNPRAKGLAHITVRGPYKRRNNIIQRLNFIISSSLIKVSGVGCFFSPNQNTVFLRCDSPELKSVWSKRDYGYNPHITLYDGSSRNFAKKLLELLQKYELSFSFPAGKLTILVSVKGQTDLKLRWHSEDKIINPIIGQQIDDKRIELMEDGERLELVDRICHYLSNPVHP